ncbi:helix-turn-helix domain-containing protein [Pedobacter sp. MC2016-14]|uniref:helix-turn-helix domain-containing protein n=1 Tax=Pedobacter sp. MC2016-14 TaxID=2897327 RepID=UPI001E5358ED|nr:helix-turn-helix domain-containing protein [Pedobacter sp. MC2016-14]MCD0489703.1 helix-turn-helix domain-containing protein [Pedobacter sp. MC2016-14]
MNFNIPNIIRWLFGQGLKYKPLNPPVQVIVVKKWITAAEAADLLKISRRSLYNNRQQFVHKRVGRAVVYCEESIREFKL